MAAGGHQLDAAIAVYSTAICTAALIAINSLAHGIRNRSDEGMGAWQLLLNGLWCWTSYWWNLTALDI